MDRTKPPQTPPIPGYKLPPVYETKLPNGLGVVLVEDARFPAGHGAAEFPGGLEVRSEGHARAWPRRSAALLTEGTKTRTARQISEETDGIGGTLGGAAGADSPDRRRQRAFGEPAASC